MSGATTMRLENPAQVDAGALPRLLRGVAGPGALGLAEHLSNHGPLPEPAASSRWGLRGRHHEQPLIEELARAGLLGRGGAAFPLATKMRAVAAARGRPVVLANGVEAEPASIKDKTLLELAPHLVLDGAQLAAQALGGDEVIVAVEEGQEAHGAVLSAVAERERTGTAAVRTQVVGTPGHYVAGQESALVNFVNGGQAKPTFTPPMPFEQGVGRRPTLVSNVETLAHAALIARHGASWFRGLGTAAQPGSMLVTISGPLAAAGVYEIECGASLTSLIEAAGGVTEQLLGALVGGYAGGWVAASELGGLALSDEHLAAHEAALGSGIVLLLSERACPVAETARLARWMAEQSARQCGPCVHGLDAIAATVLGVARGEGGPAPGRRLDRLTALTARRGACRHPDGAVRVLLSALRTFRGDFAEHARSGPCERCANASELALPDRPVSERTLRAKGWAA